MIADLEYTGWGKVVEDSLLTIQQVGEWLQVSTQTVRRFIARGELDAIKVGRQMRIRAESVEAFLEGCAV